MSDATQFNKGFNRTAGGCFGILFVFAIIFGVMFMICGGCLMLRSPTPVPTYRSTIR